MPRDGSGVHSLDPGYLAVTGETVLPSNHNPPLEDLSNAITESIARTGVTAITANIPFNDKKITGLGDATADTDALNRRTADDRYYTQTAADAKFIEIGEETPARGYVFGLGLSNNVTDSSNDIDIAAGEAASDASTPVKIALASALTKRLDSGWVVGSGNGGLDTGSIADTTYFVWLIRRSDTGVVDALFSASATSPTMPTSYDQKRRIGSVIRVSGALLAFRAFGTGATRKYEFVTVPALSYDASLGTTAATATLMVPVGIAVEAKCHLTGINAGTGTAVYMYPTFKTAQGASTTAAPLAQITISATGIATSGEVSILTDTSAQVKVVAIAASTTTRIATLGWTEWL